MNLLQNPTPTLADWGELLKKDIMRSLNCHMIGTVVTFDPAKQRADIKINFKKSLGEKYGDYPVLADCPVIVLGGGGAHLTFPISPGDHCLVLFNDVDMDKWLVGGQTMPPGNPRSHSFSDGIALVGLRPFSSPLTDYGEDCVRLKFGESLIELKDKLHLANGTTDLLTLLNDLTQILSTLLSAFSGASNFGHISGPSGTALTQLTTWKTTKLEEFLE